MASKRAADDEANVVASQPMDTDEKDASGPRVGSVVVTQKKPRLVTQDVERNRRLFGVLLKGTLDTFSGAAPTEAELKRKEIEQRMEARLQEEKRNAEAAAAKMREERTQQATQREGLKRQGTSPYMENLRSQWASQKRATSCFLRTKRAAPAILYMPVKLLPEQQEQLEAERAAAEESIKAFEEKEAQRIAAAQERRARLPGNYSKRDNGQASMQVDVADAPSARRRGSASVAAPIEEHDLGSESGGDDVVVWL